jgi:single-strand DNA-binding protein
MFHITAAGNIGKDAVLRSVGSGDSVLAFSIGCRVQKGRDQATEWLSCSMWGKRADAMAQYLKKGTPVTVTGSLTTRENDGKTYLECRVSEIALQGGKRDGQSQGRDSADAKPKPKPAVQNYDEFNEEEIPF